MAVSITDRDARALEGTASMRNALIDRFQFRTRVGIQIGGQICRPEGQAVDTGAR